MRDQTQINMHTASARRSALLFDQFEFLQTRQEAMERLWSVSTLWDRIKWVWDIAVFMKIVDAVQLSMLQERHKKRAELAAKPKIDIVPAGVSL